MLINRTYQVIFFKKKINWGSPISPTSATSKVKTMEIFQFNWIDCFRLFFYQRLIEEARCGSSTIITKRSNRLKGHAFGRVRSLPRRSRNRRPPSSLTPILAWLVEDRGRSTELCAMESESGRQREQRSFEAAHFDRPDGASITRLSRHNGVRTPRKGPPATGFLRTRPCDTFGHWLQISAVNGSDTNVELLRSSVELLGSFWGSSSRSFRCVKRSNNSFQRTEPSPLEGADDKERWIRRRTLVELK